MREKIYDIIELDEDENDVLGRAYDLFMIVVIILSLIPLMFYEQTPFLRTIDHIVAIVFIIDYILRWITADYMLGKGVWSFIKYPFTPMAVLDLVTILTSLAVLVPGFMVLKIFRLLKTLRALRSFKAFRYSENIDLIYSVIHRQSSSLKTVCYLALGYIVFCALVMFNIEPDTFNRSFFDALYWAVVSLSTTGYGDIYPVSIAGKLFNMISTVVGVALIALPSSIITAGYVQELEKRRRKENKEKLLKKKDEQSKLLSAQTNSPDTNDVPTDSKSN